MCPGGGYEMSSDREAETDGHAVSCYGLSCCYFALQCLPGFVIRQRCCRWQRVLLYLKEHADESRI